MPVRTIRDWIQKVYDDSWFDGSYTVDWVVVIGLFVLELVIGALPVFERDFSLNDPLIQHPHNPEQISSLTNESIAVVVPALLVVLMGAYRKSPHEIHHGLLATIASLTLSSVITEALKNRVDSARTSYLGASGTPRDTYALDPEEILDGRRSFPSGHSTTAFTAMTFVSLFLAGKTAALCFSVTPSCGTLFRSRLVRLCIVLVPLVFAAWVAITRIEDYRHHKEDVIVGGGIGIFSGTICYLLYWPNPFTASSFSGEAMGRPRLANGVGVGPGRDDGYRPAPEGPDLPPV